MQVIFSCWQDINSSEEILLGVSGGKYKLLNVIILSAQHFIYCCKYQHRRPLFNIFYSYLKHIFAL